MRLQSFWLSSICSLLHLVMRGGSETSFVSAWTTGVSARFFAYRFGIPLLNFEISCL